jgi:hypothetical protein
MNTATALTPTVVLADCDPRSTLNIQRRQNLRIAERDPQGRLLPGSVLPNAGRPEGPTITTLARLHTAKALETLVEIMQDAAAPPAARATCAQALLDRGYGRAPVQIDLSVRQRFDSFLKDIGIEANYERDHPVVAEAEESDE